MFFLKKIIKKVPDPKLKAQLTTLPTAIILVKEEVEKIGGDGEFFVECFKDFIRPNLNGMTFNHKLKDPSLIFANCLKILMENKKLRLKMANQALEVRKTHSADKIAKIFLSDFKRLTKS